MDYISAIFIRQLMAPPEPPTRRAIGFVTGAEMQAAYFVVSKLEKNTGRGFTDCSWYAIIRAQSPGERSINLRYIDAL